MKPRLQHVVLAAAIVLLVAVVGAFVVRQTTERAAAAEVARRYESSAASSIPTSAPVVVTVISDDLAAPAQSGTPVTEWPLLVQADLGVRVASLSSAGSGWTTRPLTAQFGGTFEARAEYAASTSKVVLIMGGANDQRATRVQLLRAASETISNAQRAAPHAVVVIVGPVSIGSHPSSSLLAVRDDLRDAASRGGARFVDPIAQDWIGSASGLVQDDDRTLTAKGEHVIAERIEAVLRPLI